MEHQVWKEDEIHLEYRQGKAMAEVRETVALWYID